MTKITCPVCNKTVSINISKAIDEEGETFKCPHCKKYFRYATN